MQTIAKRQVTTPMKPRRRARLRQEPIRVKVTAEREGIHVGKRGKGPANPFHKLRGAGAQRLGVDRYLEAVRGR